MSATHSVCKATLLYRSTWPFVIIERFAERRDSRTGSEHHTPSHLYYTELLPHRRLQGWEHDMWKNPQFWQVFPPFSQLAPSHQYYTELFFHTVDCKDGNMTCGKTHSSDRFFHHSVNWQSACSNTHTHTHTHTCAHTQVAPLTIFLHKLRTRASSTDIHGLFLLSNSVFDFIFFPFFVSVQCAKLNWSSRQLLSAR